MLVDDPHILRGARCVCRMWPGPFEWATAESGAYLTGSKTWNAKTAGDAMEVYMMD